MSYEKLCDNAYRAAGYFRRRSLQSALVAESKYIHSTAGVQRISNREYAKEILPYWKKFGRRPRKFWFELYGSMNGTVDPRLIPADIYYTEIIPYVNSLEFYRASADKCYLDRRFPEIRLAKTVCRRIGGLYYDAAMDLITEKEALRLCLAHEGGLVIKTAIYTGNSLDIHTIDPSHSSEEEIRGIFDAVGANFIAQDRIRQHPDFARLNPDSVNTVRVNSLLTEDGVSIPSAAVRIGAPGADRVAVGDGGFYAEILEDGSVNRRALMNSVKWKDPGRGREEQVLHKLIWTSDFANGRYDAAYRIPAMDKIRSLVRTLHPRLGHFRWVGWDWTVDEEGEPVLIEFNGSPGLTPSQMVSARPVFGEMTDWILEDYFIHRTWEKNAMQGFVYK